MYKTLFSMLFLGLLLAMMPVNVTACEFDELCEHDHFQAFEIPGNENVRVFHMTLETFNETKHLLNLIPYGEISFDIVDAAFSGTDFELADPHSIWCLIAHSWGSWTVWYQWSRTCVDNCRVNQCFITERRHRICSRDTCDEWDIAERNITVGRC